MIALYKTAIACGCVSLSSVAPQLKPTQADEVMGGTCRGYIEVGLAATRANDNTGLQPYLELAEKMYPILAKLMANSYGIPQIPLDQIDRGNRAVAVRDICNESPDLPYADAVTRSYMHARIGNGVRVDQSLIGKGSNR